MNKGELVRALAAATDRSEAAATRTLNAFFRIVADEVAQGHEVAIPGFGTFRRAGRAGRAGRNPQTGAPITIPASNTVKFSAGEKLRAAVRGR